MCGRPIRIRCKLLGGSGAATRFARASGRWQLTEDFLPTCSGENSALEDSQEIQKGHKREPAEKPHLVLTRYGELNT